MSHATSLTGKNIVVIGAAQGVGLGIVEELLSQGVNVVAFLLSDAAIIIRGQSIDVTKASP